MFGWHFPCCIDQPGGRLQHTPHGDAECKAIAASMALLRWQVRELEAPRSGCRLGPVITPVEGRCLLGGCRMDRHDVNTSSTRAVRTGTTELCRQLMHKTLEALTCRVGGTWARCGCGASEEHGLPLTRLRVLMHDG